MDTNQFNQMVVYGCVATVLQGEPAYERGGCKYLTSSGLRCVVGHMMTEEECKFSDNDLLIRYNESNTSNRKDPFTSKLTEEQVYFLEELQELHDESVETGDIFPVVFEVRSLELTNGPNGDPELHKLLKEAYDDIK